MNLKEILSISGYSGLFRYVSQGRTGVIVEGLIDKKRMNTSASTRVSALEDIAVYTDEKELPLKEIFRRIFTKENGGKTIEPKSDNDKLRKYFSEIVPNYDIEKVYISDMRKLYTWYNILLGENMIDLVEDKINEDETLEEAQPEVVKEVKEQKVKKETQPAKAVKAAKDTKTSEPEKATKTVKAPKTEKRKAEKPDLNPSKPKTKTPKTTK